MKRLLRRARRFFSRPRETGGIPPAHASFSCNALRHIDLFRKDRCAAEAVTGWEALAGEVRQNGELLCLMHEGASARFSVNNARAVALVFRRHPWSGAVRVTVNGRPPRIFDLGFPFQVDEPHIVAAEEKNTVFDIRLEVLPPYPARPNANEVVLWKVLTVPEEPPGPAKEAAKEAAGEAEDEGYYEKVNYEQFVAWDNHIKNLGLTAEQARTITNEAYAGRMEKVWAGAPEGGRVLDVGCGFCESEYLRPLLEKRALAYYGHDISDLVVDHNAREMAQCGWRDRFTLGRNTALPFEDGFFDFVYSGHCLEHSDDIEKTCSEIRRVLKPGGKFHFFVPITWDESPEHIYYFNTLCWGKLFEHHGFALERMAFGKHYNPLQDDYDSELVLTKGTG